MSLNSGGGGVCGKTARTFFSNHFPVQTFLLIFPFPLQWWGIRQLSSPITLSSRRYANDLNPNSHSALLVNIKLNKVESKVAASNMCARDFIRKLNRDVASKNPASTDFTHCVMNLPASLNSRNPLPAANLLEGTAGLLRLPSNPF